MADDVRKPEGGLSNEEALVIFRAAIEKLDSLILEELDRDAAKLASVDLFDALVIRAKWQKRIDYIFQANRLFGKRYGNPRGELRLVEERFGDQIGIAPRLTANDVKGRLEWYKRRVAKDFARTIDDGISLHAVDSPIEQIFLMEWYYLARDERFGPKIMALKLDPHRKLKVDDNEYEVDFLITGQNKHKIAVELDGHDFHEKTREQVSRDKSRERSLTLAGFTVFRFSGSEICRNSRRCVEQVIELATDLDLKQ
jgi:very-short-patch-repair endonuclease